MALAGLVAVGPRPLHVRTFEREAVKSGRFRTRPFFLCIFFLENGTKNKIKEENPVQFYRTTVAPPHRPKHIYTCGYACTRNRNEAIKTTS